MIRVAYENPFAGAYSSPFRPTDFDTVRKALAHVRQYIAAKPTYYDETPCDVERVDGRTIATLLKQGCTIRVERIYGRPEAWIWDREAVQSLDRANGDAE